MKPRKIMFFVMRMNNLGGTATHILNLVRAIDKTRFKPRLFISTSNRQLVEDHFYSVKEYLHVTSNSGWLLFLPMLWKLVGYKKWFRPDVLHTFQLQSDIFGGLSEYFYRTKKVISHVEGLRNQNKGLKKWMLSALDRLTRKFFNHYIFISDYLFNQYEGKRPASRIYLGIGQAWFEDPLPVRNPESLKVGFIGRLEHEKGPDIFIKIAQENPKHRFIVIGDGKMKEDLARDFLGWNISFAGWVKDERLKRERIDELDAVLIPSRREGLSYVAIEAMARNKLVYAFQEGGLKEIVTPDTGVSIFKNPVDLVSPFSIGLRTYSYYRRRAYVGYRHVLNNHRLGQEIKEIEKIYTGGQNASDLCEMREDKRSVGDGSVVGRRAIM